MGEVGEGGHTMLGGKRVPLPVWLAMAVGLLLRLHHVWVNGDLPLGEAPIMDALYHVEWARAMAAGTSFVDEAYFRVPLYPFFLSLLERLLGEELLGWRLAQSLLGCVGVWATWLLGREACGPRTGILAAWFLATAWMPVHFDGELLIPTLLLPLTTLALWSSVRLAKAPTPRSAGLTGLLWGAATLARPTVLIFAPVLFFLVAFRKGNRGAALVLALSWGACVLPVTVRNRIVGGEWVMLATQSGVNLWIGNNPSSDGATAVVPGTRAGWWEGFEDARAQARAAEGRDLSPSEISSHYTGRVLTWLEEEPGAFLSHLAWKLRLLVANRELGNNLEPTWFGPGRDPLLTRWWIPFALLHALALLGARELWRRREPGLRVLVLFPWVYLLGVLAFFVCARFRLPVWPALCVLAAEGLLVVLLRPGAWGARGSALGLTLLGFAANPPGLFDPEALGEMQIAESWLASGEPSRALPHLSTALAREEPPPAARLLMGQVRLALGEPEKALRELEPLAGRWDLLDAGEVHVRALLAAGRAAEGEELAREWLHRAGVAPAIRYQLGRALAARGAGPEALVEFEQVLRQDSRHAGAAFALARLATEAGQSSRQAWERAARLWERLPGGAELAATARAEAARAVLP